MRERKRNQGRRKNRGLPSRASPSVMPEILNQASTEEDAFPSWNTEGRWYPPGRY